MTEKYIDLASRISDDLEPTMAGEAYICNALRWLDKHPDQVPGLTMTETEMEHNCSIYGQAYETGFRQAGGQIVPDPEPTNAEKITADLEEWGIFHSVALELGPWLDGQGWTKAPETTDD